MSTISVYIFHKKNRKITNFAMMDLFVKYFGYFIYFYYIFF